MVRSPNTGCVLLREALCRYLARNRGIRVRPDQIVIGAGAEYLYGLVIKGIPTDTEITFTVTPYYTDAGSGIQNGASFRVVVNVPST